VNFRISKDSTAVVVEVGRPGVRTTLADVEKVCTALATAGVSFDPGSGVTGLMVDVGTGKLQPDILDERVMHAMIHYTCPNDHLPAGLRALREVSGRVNTVLSIGFSNLLDAEGIGPAIAICDAAGLCGETPRKYQCRYGVRQKERGEIMTHSLHRDGDSQGLQDDYVMLVLTGLDRAGDPEVKRQMQEVWDILASRTGEPTA
jgi:hypothetical protein